MACYKYHNLCIIRKQLKNYVGKTMKFFTSNNPTTQVVTVLLLLLVTNVTCDIIFNNSVFNREEVYDLLYADDSNVTSDLVNQTKYYCIFRGNWDNNTQPNDYPIQLARWGEQAIFSHTKQYTPFLKDLEAPFGVEKLAETGFSDEFHEEVITAGPLVYSFANNNGFVVNNKNTKKNFQYIPPVNVSYEYSFITGLAGIIPSPDWFTNFYLFDVIKTQQQTYWERFVIHTYPWDAGTDLGQLYTDYDTEQDPPGTVIRMTPENVPNKIFLDKDNKIPYVAEWECVRHTCPIEDPGCTKENWPPSNGCDILKYPECAITCDPKTSTAPCELCANDEYHSDCCVAGFDPKIGIKCDDGTESDKKSSLASSSGAATVSNTEKVFYSIVSTTLVVLVGIVYMI